MIKFSVIVPVYNTASYLERCVDSLRKQSLSEIEMILVDDGSSDSSPSMCDSFGRADQRIRVIHKRNEGQGLARNAGLDIAQGKYVLFIDSDDYIEEDTCRSLFSYMEEKNLQLCSFGYVIEDQQGKEVRRVLLKEKSYEGEAVRREFILHFFGDSQNEEELRGVSACMTAFSRQLIQEHVVRFPSERKVLSEDTVFNLELCQYVERAAVLPSYFYHYCQNASSFSHAYRVDRFTLTKHLCRILEDYAQKYEIDGLVRGRIGMLMWVNLMECIKQEVRRKNAKAAQIYGNVRKMCADPAVQEALGRLRPEMFVLKQRIMLYCIKKRWTLAAVLMAWLRNRKGL